MVAFLMGWPPAVIRLTLLWAKVGSHGHKQGSVAVAFSVFGLVAIVVAIVITATGSIQRRRRDAPPNPGFGDRKPPDKRRGLFG
jgi:hypothetical protein